MQKFRQFWKQFYDATVKMLGDTENILLTLLQLIIVAFGIAIALSLVVMIEQQRVMSGVLLLSDSEDAASKTAWVLVLLNLILEIYGTSVERGKRYAQQVPAKFSLALMSKGMRYRLGLSEGKGHWKPQRHSPAIRFHRLANTVAYAILAFAVAGSMHSIIEQQGNIPWYQALENILAKSNLQSMFSWIGGVFLAVALVRSAQALARYVADVSYQVKKVAERREAARLRKSEAAVNVNLRKISENATINKPTYRENAALEWLKEHPEYWKTPRDIAAAAYRKDTDNPISGVTMGKAQKQYTNGHGTSEVNGV